jgi:hypothetical protein
VISWNVQSKKIGVVIPALEALMSLGLRPVFCLQEVLSLTNRMDDSTPAADGMFAAFLRQHKYAPYFGFTAVTRDGSTFSGTRGAAVLAPLESSPHVDFHNVKQLTQKHRNIDIAAVELRDFKTRVISAYCHPSGLRVDDIISDIVNIMPPNSIVGADFNVNLVASTSTPAENRQLSCLAGACMSRGIIIVAPESPTTASRHIDGFLMMHNAARVPCCSSAAVLDFKEGPVSDHRPTMMAIRGVHKTRTYLQPSTFALKKVTTRHIVRLHRELHRLMDAPGADQREPHDILLEAANRELPKTARRWVRAGTEHNTSFRENMIKILRSRDLAKALEAAVPRRMPRNVQPLTNAAGAVLASDQEKADAAEKHIADVLHQNAAPIAAEYTWNDVLESAKDNEPIKVAEVMYAQHRMSAKTARDKHGVPPGLIKRLYPASLQRLVDSMFTKAVRLGDISSAIKTTRVAMIDKPGKNSNMIEDRRPITIIDQNLQLADRIVERRVAVDCAKVPGVIALSQTACCRKVPCDLQAQAAVQHAANLAASGMSLFRVGNPPEAPNPAEYRNLNAAVRILVPGEISDQIMTAADKPFARAPTIYRITATRLLLVDQSGAYCHVNLNALMNRLYKYPQMRKHMAYAWGVNYGR